MEEIKNLYKSKAPKWFRTIRWREITNRWIVQQKVLFGCITLPSIAYPFLCGDFWPHALAWYQPKNEEELFLLRQNFRYREYARDPKIKPGQYYNDIVPRYDLAERRKKYPQYYEGRYDGDRKYYV